MRDGALNLMRGWGRVAQGARVGLLATALVFVAAPALGQQVRPAGEITVAVGNSAVVEFAGILDDVTIGNPAVAQVIPVSGSEVVINGVAAGTTTLVLFDSARRREVYTIRVTADAPSLNREFARLFPDEQQLQATAMGNTVILSGEVGDPLVARQAFTLAETLGEGVSVVDHMNIPVKGQILLEVRFAEVARNAMEELGASIMRVDPANLRGDDEIAMQPGTTPFSSDFTSGSGPEATFSDAINFFLFHDASKVSVFITALHSRGLFKSLAEPNLLAMPAESASFLAGGEFPYPVLQGSGQSNAVTIQFKEFGIKLDFLPDITPGGAIRLWVRPEVSALDFTGGLQLGGFQIPALISRRAETVIELRDGQTFAIAGLLDSSLMETINKVPLLGDIPLLGYLFRSKQMRQRQTELLVLVTPRIVYPQNEAPPIPTGEPDTWLWDKSLQDTAPEGSEDGSDDSQF